MKVYITQTQPEPSVKELLGDHQLVFGEAGLSEEELGAAVADADAILATPPVKISSAILEKARNLRIVANGAVGTDNIDLGACKERGIPVTNTPGVLTETTADLAWALILCVARRIREAENVARSGTWAGWRPTELLGVSLTGKTLGIFGLGRIGAAVAKRGEAFGMRILGMSEGDGPDVFERLLSESDVLTLHCPLTPQTRNRFSRTEFDRIKPGAILVNTARGAVVDTDALLWALDAGRLRGAGLDVYPEEPRIDPRLLSRDDVVLLPHVGSATLETRLAMARTACKEILRAFRGETLVNRVV
jgi:glyoxylate reductase